MKFLNKKLMMCSAYNIAEIHQFHAIRLWNFRIFAVRWWPRFLRHPVCMCVSLCNNFAALWRDPCCSSTLEQSIESVPLHDRLLTAHLRLRQILRVTNVLIITLIGYFHFDIRTCVMLWHLWHSSKFWRVLY